MNPPANLPSNALWQGYAAGTDWGEAKRTFGGRFGRDPDHVWEWGIVFVGPITQEEHDEKRGGLKWQQDIKR